METQINFEILGCYSRAVSMTAILSVSSQRRLFRARAWLENRGKTEEVLLVGATLDAANELARGAAAQGGAVFGWHRLSISQLASTIAAPVLAARGLVPIARLGAEAVVASLLHRLRAEGELSLYEPVADTPGFSRAISEVIAELRLAQVQSADLESTAPGLVPVLRAYERELTESNFVDWPGVLHHATEAAKLVPRHRLIGLPTLLLDVPAVSAAEFSFIDALAAAAPETVATIPAADRPTLNRFRAQPGFDVEELDALSRADQPEPNSGSALARLQRNLFGERETSFSADASDDAIEVFSAPGEGRECVEIVRRVLALARDGVPFDRIAVLLRSAPDYRAHLQEAFSRAEIPVHFARGAVRPDPAGRAFYALLQCANEKLSARRFAEYLSLGQVPDATTGGRPPEAVPPGDQWASPDPELVPQLVTEMTNDAMPRPPADAPVQDGQLRAPRRWERLLVEAAVIGGRDRWRRRIDGLTNELMRKRAEIGSEDEIQADTLARALDDLTAFAAYALPLIDDLDALPATAHWGEWLDLLGALATRALKTPDRVLAILAEIAPIAPVGPVALNEVLLVLRELLLETSVPPSAQRYGKIFVGPIDTARGLSFDTVFVPGLAEKMFPRKIVEEPILLDDVRALLKSDLVTNERRLERERLGLALAVGAAERRIFLSYPRIDLDQARPRVASFYALEAMRSAEGQLPDFAELARRAEAAADTRLGWPAPVDPETAIDDAEHDLAVLSGLMGLSTQGGGQARYLLTANPYLARALRSRYQRWSPNWTSADGLLNTSPAIRAILNCHGLGSRGYSPTGLQAYARCPYRFFLQAIHGLAPREVPAMIDELDPLQRGSLFHDVQFALFARLRDESLLPVRPANLDRAKQLLEEITTVVAARYQEDLAPAIDRVWENGVTAIRADLREWLRRASTDASGFVPTHFELSFGLTRRSDSRNADPGSVSDVVDLDCGIRLRGSIDLLERHPSGLFRVTDHKTGKADGTGDQVIAGGRTLQPVFYALAAEKLSVGNDKVAEGRLYFCTSIGGFAQRSVPLDERARAAAAQVAVTVGDAINQPFLPAAPGERECERCNYRSVCGPYEEYRVRRKPQGNLQRLSEVRAWP
jgi:hypothetical protein